MVNRVMIGATVDEPLKKRVRAYARRNKVSESEGLRRLVQVGLDADLAARKACENGGTPR